MGMASIPSCPLDHMPGFRDICFTFANFLSTLFAHDLAELIMTVTQLVEDFPKIFCPINIRERSPVIKSRPRGVNRPIDFLRCCLRKFPEGFPRGWVLALECLRTGATDPLSPDEVSMRLSLLGHIVELRVVR